MQKDLRMQLKVNRASKNILYIEDISVHHRGIHNWTSPATIIRDRHSLEFPCLDKRIKDKDEHGV